MKPLVIFGSAEIAQLARYYFTEDSDYRVVAFTVDDQFVNSDQVDGLPLIPWSEMHTRFPPETVDMHVALSYRQLNKLRQRKYEDVKAAGYRLASYICSKSVYWPDLSHGDNCFILENQTIQPTVKIGSNVMIWSGNHIGHGTVISDHAYISSHVVLCGHSRIGQRCFLGVNSAVRDFTSVGDDCFVAMGVSVNRDMAAGSVALAAAGDVLPPDDRRAGALIRKTFG